MELKVLSGEYYTQTRLPLLLPIYFHDLSSIKYPKYLSQTISNEVSLPVLLSLV